jgi:uncharacterized pyridoxamine 5'-phosphate oxidase family protein
MTLSECIDFSNSAELSFLATTEKDQPRVRGITFWFADQTGFYFQTGTMKRMVGQLKENPKTEICFWQSDPSSKTGKTPRISGEVEFVDDRGLKERALSDKPFLKNFGFTAESPDLILFKPAHGQAGFWSMGTNLKPREYATF